MWRSTKWTTWQTPMKGISLESMIPTLVPNFNFSSKINFNNTSTTRNALPYPIYIFWSNLNAHIEVFINENSTNGKCNNGNNINLYDDISKWGKKICKSHELCLWWIGSWFLQKGVERFNLMNKSTWHCVPSSKKLMKRLKYITKEFWKWQISFNIKQMKGCWIFFTRLLPYLSILPQGWSKTLVCTTRK